MAQIICRNLAIGYDGKAIVQNMNFSVNTGEYLCVIGENGAGKSTFMKTLLGLQPPIQGEILFGDNLKQNEIGYLPQQTEVQKDFPASVREIVLSGCQNQLGLRPFYNRKEKSYAEAILNKLQIWLSNVTGNCPEDRSKEFYLPEPYVQQKRCYCWMNQWQDLIQRPRKKCII